MEQTSIIQPTVSPPPAPAIKPDSTNYAAAVFFTLLIVGFTFHLPTLLYVPVLFFCIGAGVLFFRDIMTARKAPQPVAGQPGVYSNPSGISKKKRSRLKTLLLSILVLIGLCALAYIGLVIFVVISLSSSGV